MCGTWKCAGPKINMKCLILLAVCTFAVFRTGHCKLSAVSEKNPPKFADSYTVSGVLYLPYAEIKETFIAYYDKQRQKSRIDYYGDMVKTYQRADLGDNGISYKIAYMTDNGGNPIRTCFQINGSEDNPVDIQSIFPDLSSFTYQKLDSCYPFNGVTGAQLECEVWTYETAYKEMINKYTMYLKKDTQEPVYYVMKGYDSLLGSHYDKYEVSYMGYKPGNVPENMFEVDTGIPCGGFPGPGVKDLLSNNPMREFIDNVDDHIHEEFANFKSEHGKKYAGEKEHRMRNNIFRQNYRYIHSINRAGLSFALRINHMADFTDQEMRRIRGKLFSKGYNGGKPFPKEEFSDKIPDDLDWRLYGAVSQVKDQAVCGSCWSFGTTGTIEGANFLKTGRIVRLSQQQLIDCSWQYQNNGCDGGEDFRAYKYIMDIGGLATEEEYGDYLGQDGKCHDKNVTKSVKISGFVNVTSGDSKALAQAIAKKGPISVSIDASHKSFSFYSHGVYYEPACKNGVDELDHSVLAVGYGVINDEPYWLIKNSWSTYWGNDGYVLMSKVDNNCGVATSPTYVIMAE